MIREKAAAFSGIFELSRISLISSNEIIGLAVPFSNRFSDLLSSTAIATARPTLLEGKALSREVESISFRFSDLLRNRKTFLAAAWTLRREGIICLREAAPAELIASINKDVGLLLKEIEAGDHGRLASLAYLNLPDQRVLKGYNQFRDADRPVINYRVKRPDGRSGSDAGMIDIFHPERLSDSLNRSIHVCLQESVIQRLLLISSFNRMRVKCRNLYLNRGVQDTRSYHCDGRSLKFKSFVYLSDVQSLADGPYCFVPKSQRRRRLWWRNARYNKRQGLGPFEFSQLQGTEAISLFAKAGDMVLSSQRGAHCGHPQQPQASRAVLVNMFQR